MREFPPVADSDSSLDWDVGDVLIVWGHPRVSTKLRNETQLELLTWLCKKFIVAVPSVDMLKKRSFE